MGIEDIFKHIEGDENPLLTVEKTRKKRTNKTYMNIGMFIKMIANFEIFFIKFKRELNNNEGIDLDEDRLRNNLKKIIYTRAYDNLSKLNLNNESQIKFAFKFNNLVLKSSTQKALDFFELIEDFEKCHFIKMFQEKVGLKNKLGLAKNIQ